MWYVHRNRPRRVGLCSFANGGPGEGAIFMHGGLPQRGANSEIENVSKGYSFHTVMAPQELRHLEVAGVQSALSAGHGAVVHQRGYQTL